MRGRGRSPPTAWATRGLLSHRGHPEGPVHPQSSRGPAEAFVHLLRFRPPPCPVLSPSFPSGACSNVPPHCCLPESPPRPTRPAPPLPARPARPLAPTFCCTSDRTSRFCCTWAGLPSPSGRDPPSGDRPLPAVSLMCLKGLKRRLAGGRWSTKRRTNMQTHAWGRLSLKEALEQMGE